MNKIEVNYFKDISFADPSENILYDDVLLAMAEEGLLGNTLRIWESPIYFVVLGRTGKVEEDLNYETLRKDDVPVLRRSSGGGTVLQGAGCLNFSFILSKENNSDLVDLRRSYHVILEGVLSALKQLQVTAVFRPISDLALADNEKKFSGNAQRRGRRFILHHGTILYDFDLTLVSRYLTMPHDIPEYRRGRSHGDFITNIPVLKKDLLDGFYYTYCSVGQDIVSKPTSAEHQRLSKLLQSRPPLVKF
jgi:lipoate-protein ligase A